VVNKDFHKLTL